MGSQKNTPRPLTGSLPISENRATPSTTVMARASRGEAQAQVREGAGRSSSRSIGVLLRVGGAGVGVGPQPAHPLADQLHGGVLARQAGRELALGDHVQAVAQLEQ